MKKIFRLCMLSFLVMACIPLVTQAQTSLISTGNSLARDTVTNTATKTWALAVTSAPKTITIQVDYTKISGTLAGSITPVASNDGATFWSVSSRVTRDTTLAVGNASGGYNYSMPPGWRYYGIQWTGTGTMSGSLVAKLSAK